MKGAWTGRRDKIGGLHLPWYQCTIRDIEWPPSVAVLEDESLVVYLPIWENAAHAVGISRPFIVGRFLVYTAVGFLENVVPTYQSEIVPAPLRAFLVGSLIAGIINQSMASNIDNSGWQIATASQTLPVVIMCFSYFTPNSPRWLVFNDRDDEALAVLKKLRTKRNVNIGVSELEIASMREDGHIGRQTKGSWADLIKGNNRRRLAIACGIMLFQQLTGITFSSSYGPTFYKSVGLGANAYTHALSPPVINNAVFVVTAPAAMILIDNNGVVAGMIIYNAILHMALGPGAYITAAEIGTRALREKTTATPTAVNVVAGFVVVFVTPYLLVSIGAGLGYIWGGGGKIPHKQVDNAAEPVEEDVEDSRRA
ncbi:sugar transporter [Seiridium cupressi]